MAARRIAFCDVTNRPGTTWLAQLTEDQADAVANLRVSDLRLARQAKARNAATEAAGRHYAHANYR
jgi:hypothetical protein